MNRFTTSIRASLVSNNWFPALFMSLALPDICGALESPHRPVGDRYKDWFNRYLREKYNPSSAYEALLAVSPEVAISLPADIIEGMKNQPALTQTAFTAEDCYRLRCKCLHQGLPERIGNDRIHFTSPDPTGRLTVHRNCIKGVLQISIDQFCLDVCIAVDKWVNDHSNDQAVIARSAELIKVYDLDDNELPIVSYR